MNIIDLAKLCLEAYIKSGNSSGFKYIVKENVVAISGTDHRRDWLDNINIFPLNPHHNKYRQYAEDIINEVGYNSSIIFTGHSAGGAIAHICADLTDASAVSFGAPMISKKNYVVKGTHIRYALTADPVSKIRIGDKHHQIMLKGLGHNITKYLKALYEQTL